MPGLTDLAGLAGAAAAIAAVLLRLPGIARLRRAHPGPLLLAALVAALVPLGTLPAAGYLRGIVGDLSITTVLLLLRGLLRPVLGGEAIDARSRRRPAGPGRGGRPRPVSAGSRSRPDRSLPARLRERVVARRPAGSGARRGAPAAHPGHLVPRARGPGLGPRHVRVPQPLGLPGRPPGLGLGAGSPSPPERAGPAQASSDASSSGSPGRLDPVGAGLGLLVDRHQDALGVEPHPVASVQAHVPPGKTARDR